MIEMQFVWSSFCADKCPSFWSKTSKWSVVLRICGILSNILFFWSDHSIPEVVPRIIAFAKDLICILLTFSSMTLWGTLREQLTLKMYRIPISTPFRYLFLPPFHSLSVSVGKRYTESIRWKPKTNRLRVKPRW